MAPLSEQAPGHTFSARPSTGSGRTGVVYALHPPIPQVDTERPESARIARSSPQPPVRMPQDPVIERQQSQKRSIAGLAAAPAKRPRYIRTRTAPSKASVGRSSGVTFRAGILLPCPPSVRLIPQPFVPPRPHRDGNEGQETGQSFGEWADGFLNSLIRQVRADFGRVGKFLVFPATFASGGEMDPGASPG